MKLLDIEILFIRTIICVISTVGCLWHLSDVARIYLTYETDVNLDFEKDSMIDLPAVTLCVSTNSVIREDYMSQRFPLGMESFLNSTNRTEQVKSKSEWLLNNLRKLTLNEQLNHATYGYKDIFNSCQIMTPLEFGESNRDYINCEFISPIREYITYYKKCFLIAAQLRNENMERFTVDHDVTLRDNGFPLFLITLNNRFLEKPVIFVQPRRVPFMGFIGGQTNGVHLNNTKYVSYVFSYSKTTLDLLPYPYQTMCRDYWEIGYKSLSHCILTCKAKYFINNFDGWHPDIPVSEEYYEYLNGFYARHDLKENKTLDKIVAESCRQQCGKQDDCHSEYFSMNQIGHFERTNVHEHHSIYIYLPTGINPKYFHSPRLHLTEFICYFGSIFSLWFGFSMITTSKMAIKLYKLYHKAREPNEQSFKHIISKGSSMVRIRVADKCLVR